MCTSNVDIWADMQCVQTRVLLMFLVNHFDPIMLVLLLLSSTKLLPPLVWRFLAVSKVARERGAVFSNTVNLTLFQSCACDPIFLPHLILPERLAWTSTLERRVRLNEDPAPSVRLLNRLPHVPLSNLCTIFLHPSIIFANEQKCVNESRHIPCLIPSGFLPGSLPRLHGLARSCWSSSAFEKYCCVYHVVLFVPIGRYSRVRRKGKR